MQCVRLSVQCAVQCQRVWHCIAGPHELIEGVLQDQCIGVMQRCIYFARNRCCPCSPTQAVVAHPDARAIVELKHAGTREADMYTQPWQFLDMYLHVAPSDILISVFHRSELVASCNRLRNFIDFNV